MPNPVVHFEIQSSDADKTRSFFAEVFGWSLADAPMPDGTTYSIVDTQSDGVGINGGIGPSFDAESRTAFYIAVDDPQEYLDKAAAAGGSIVMPVTTIPGAVTMAFFSDPTGATVGLVANETPPAE